jgi:predicted lysophospholipase L1 biosynthesis ABC-type transport system permease subunit
MSLGLGVTLLLTLAMVGTNFKREVAKTIPEILLQIIFLLAFKILIVKSLKTVLNLWIKI